MKKSTITAAFYTLLTPINVWTGFELGNENYMVAIPLVIMVMVFEFLSVKFWFEAQTEEIKNADLTQPQVRPRINYGIGTELYLSTVKRR